MSISNQTNQIYGTGDGTTTVFNFPFKIFNASELQVYLVNISTNVSTLQSITTNYTVWINPVAEGGQVTFVTPPPVGYYWFISRLEPFTQTVVIPTEGALPALQISNQLDLLTMLCIQMNQAISQCIQVATPYIGAPALTLPTPQPGYLLGWGNIGQLANIANPSAVAQWGLIGANINYIAGLVSMGTVDATLGCLTLGFNVVTGMPLHTVHDETIINLNSAGSAYACFDIQATMEGAYAYDHFIGLQVRPIYTGSGGITSRYEGINCNLVHNGVGTAALTTGLHIEDVGGLGPITNNYGLLIDSIARGTNNYSIYTMGGQHVFGGNVSIETSSAGFPLTIVCTEGKAQTSQVPGIQIQTNDASNPFFIAVQLQGAASLSGRNAQIQTGGDATYGGYLALQPQGGNVGIGAGAGTQATAILEAASTTQGFLPPRMTTTQKNAINSPAEGLCVYDLTLHALCFYNGSTWKTVTAS